MIVIFTDLDGTLLDENYSFEEAKDVLEEIKKRDIPLIFCSAKTREEQEYFLELMDISHPFIVEDGSAIYVPQNYFKRRFGESFLNYERRILGVKRERILRRIRELEERGLKMRGFYNMSVDEISKLTGLRRELAELAMKREFSEIIVEAEEMAIEKLREEFSITCGGRFLHVYGKDADKGRATRILTEFFREEFGEVTTVGIGNSYTDGPMLRNVDVPILVRNPDGWAEMRIENLRLIDEIGPRGFSKALREFFPENQKVY